MYYEGYDLAYLFSQTAVLDAFGKYHSYLSLFVFVLFYFIFIHSFIYVFILSIH